MEAHHPYELRLLRSADFRVRYHIYSLEEGGRWSPVQQGYCPNLVYKNDGQYKNSAYMILPEFEDQNGEVILDSTLPIALTGTARMWIVTQDFIEYHRQHLHLGVTGYFIEGQKKIGEWEVIELVSLTQPLTSPTNRKK